MNSLAFSLADVPRYPHTVVVTGKSTSLYYSTLVASYLLGAIKLVRNSPYAAKFPMAVEDGLIPVCEVEMTPALNHLKKMNKTLSMAVKQLTEQAEAKEPSISAVSNIFFGLTSYFKMHRAVDCLDYTPMPAGEDARMIRDEDAVRNKVIHNVSTRYGKKVNQPEYTTPEKGRVHWMDDYTMEIDQNALDAATKSGDPEEKFAALIRSHVRLTRLPMAKAPVILAAHQRRIVQIFELIKKLNPIRVQVSRVKDAFARSIFAANSSVNPEHVRHLEDALNSMTASEFRAVKMEIPISIGDPFIFGPEQLAALEIPSIATPATALQILNYYIGFDVSELDLSQSYITGSAIAACFENRHTHSMEQKKQQIDVHYPAMHTKLKDDTKETRAEIIKLMRTTWCDKVIRHNGKEGTIRFGDRVFSFTMKEGADIDIAVTKFVSDAQFDEIARNHFSVFQAHHAGYKMIKHQINESKYNWRFVAAAQDQHPFRSVEVYRSNLAQICSHHVGAVRGCYTGALATDGFYLTASAVLTFIQHNPNYHYFAGKKSRPQDVIIKYGMRGIVSCDSILEVLIREYCKTVDIIPSERPFMSGWNVPYSLYALLHETKLTCYDYCWGDPKLIAGLPPLPTLQISSSDSFQSYHALPPLPTFQPLPVTPISMGVGKPPRMVVIAGRRRRAEKKGKEEESSDESSD
jgi:hypothetical protein